MFNAAAVKHVPISEYNPIEAIRVNIIGLENIIQRSLNYNVKKLIQITTDKTINPTIVKGETFFLSRVFGVLLHQLSYNY